MLRRSLLFVIATSLTLSAQQLSPTAASLLQEITNIKTVDNHTHLTFSDDDIGYDALRCDTLTSNAQPPFPLRNEDGIFDQARRALFGLKEPSGDALIKAEAAAKNAKRQQF